MAVPAKLNLNYINECTKSCTSKMLGEGAFGEVFLGTDQELNHQFAVKRTPMQVPTKGALDQIILSFKREILVSCTCHCV
jgi:serine/threonine protein kinase